MLKIYLKLKVKIADNEFNFINLINYKMDSLKNKANNFFMAVATPFIGVLKDSKFIEKGILTAEEFVIAGD